MAVEHGAGLNLVMSIGHSTRALEVFIDLLKEHGAGLVVDVRTIPRSRRSPHFSITSLEDALSGAGIGYTHMSGLGGLRRPRSDSPNQGWRNAGFRGFADHMRTEEFQQSLSQVVELAVNCVLVLMCAEALPWRCHRWLISDALCVRGVRVEHIMSGAVRRPHSLTSFARLMDDRLVYPAGAQPQDVKEA